MFDLPHVVPAARRALDEAGLAGRCRVVGGSFLEDPLPAADVLVLAQILHDWPDPEAVAILRACRAAIATGGRLLVLEQVVADGDGPSFAAALDLLMLVLLGGRERSEDEWRALLAAGGFELVRITPARGTNLLEAAPA